MEYGKFNHPSLVIGWLKPCYYCNMLTGRRKAYKIIHIMYLCKDCQKNISQENITDILPPVVYLNNVYLTTIQRLCF